MDGWKQDGRMDRQTYGHKGEKVEQLMDRRKDGWIQPSTKDIRRSLRYATVV